MHGTRKKKRGQHIDANRDEDEDENPATAATSEQGNGRKEEGKTSSGSILAAPAAPPRHRDPLLKGTTRRGGRGLKSAVTESPIIFRSLSFPPNQRIKASLQGPASVFPRLILFSPLNTDVDHRATCSPATLADRKSIVLVSTTTETDRRKRKRAFRNLP